MKRLLIAGLLLLALGCACRPGEVYRVCVDERLSGMIPITHSCGNGCSFIQMIPIYECVRYEDRICEAQQ